MIKVVAVSHGTASVAAGGSNWQLLADATKTTRN